MSLPNEQNNNSSIQPFHISNSRGDVVAVVTDIRSNDNVDENTQSMDIGQNELAQPSPQHLLSTTSDQSAKILPALDPPNTDSIKEFNDNMDEDIDLNAAISMPNNNDDLPPPNDDHAPQQSESRWNKDNRMILKQLMGSLPPYDIGAALRVILDTFGVESSKLVRRGEYIELDLKEINDDYILDSLWNYCAQMQFNIMSTLQSQQIAQQQMHYPMQQVIVQQPNYYQQPGVPQPPMPPMPDSVQQIQPLQMQQIMDGTTQMYNLQQMQQMQQQQNTANAVNDQQ